MESKGLYPQQRIHGRHKAGGPPPLASQPCHIAIPGGNTRWRAVWHRFAVSRRGLAGAASSPCIVTRLGDFVFTRLARSAHRASSTRAQVVSASPSLPAAHSAAARAARTSAKSGYRLSSVRICRIAGSRSPTCQLVVVGGCTRMCNSSQRPSAEPLGGNRAAQASFSCGRHHAPLPGAYLVERKRLVCTGKGKGGSQRRSLAEAVHRFIPLAEACRHGLRMQPRVRWNPLNLVSCDQNTHGIDQPGWQAAVQWMRAAPPMWLPSWPACCSPPSALPRLFQAEGSSGAAASTAR